MFVTVNETMELTGAEVAEEAIPVAQAIIESYVGRVEAEVTNANDLMLLGRATAYQAVYMRENLELVFEQIDVKQQQGFGGMVTFRDNPASPWVAPLAIIACQRLSWKRMRSVKTGSIFAKPVEPLDWSTD